MMNATTKADVDTRLKRVAGQVAGIQRMLDEDRYCVDVLHQIAAARAALAKVASKLLASHIQTCVTSAFNSPDPAQRATKIDELVELFDKQCK